MAHPYAGQAKASQKRRLGVLNAKAGKSHGSSSMYKKTGYPSKGAGTQREYTISGGTSRKRADRMAAGGSVGRKRRGHSTTNIIISHAGGQGGTGAGGGGATARPAMPVPAPVPVNRPVPVPAGAAPAGPGPAGPVPVPMRPPVAPAAGPPVGAVPVAPRPPMPAGPPPGAALPPGAARPPGMRAGGSVKKAAKGGFLRDGPGKSYPGFPHSPTTKSKSAVSAHKKGGVVGGFKQGGIARRAEGGPAGGLPPISPGGGAAMEALGRGLSTPGPLSANSGPGGGGGGGGGGGDLGGDVDTSGGIGGGSAPADTDVTISTGGPGPRGIPRINTNIDKLVEGALAGQQRKRGGAVRRAEGGTTPAPDIQVSDQVVAGTGGGGMGPDAGSDDQPGKKQYSDTPKMGGDFKGGGGVKKRQMGGGAMGSSFGASGQPQQQQGGLLGPGPGRAPTPAIQGPPTISGRPARPAMPLTVPQPPTLGARLQRPAPGMTVGYNKGGAVKKYRDWGKGQKATSGGSMSPRLPNSENYHQQGKGFADGGAVHGAGSAAGRMARNKAR